MLEMKLAAKSSMALSVALLALLPFPAVGQDGPAPANPDAQIVTTPEHPRTQAQLLGDAWTLLETSLADTKHVDTEIQALSALGTMGGNPRSLKMIAGAFDSPEVDVRTAAVLAAGQTHSRTLEPQLRRMLDDKEPQVAFVAASTLWKMGDHSGEDILTSVVDGDRKANAGLVHGSMHQASREMHNPAAMAKLGALEGASILLGPFGFGITAYEYIKKNGGDSARVTAIEEIAQLHTAEVRKELIEALTDKDPTVRAAAAKAVRFYHDEEAEHGLAMLMQDSKKPVQLTAAACYLISTRTVALPPPEKLEP